MISADGERWQWRGGGGGGVLQLFFLIFHVVECGYVWENQG